MVCFWVTDASPIQQGFRDLSQLTGKVETIGTTKSRSPKRAIDVLFFRIKGFEQTLGIYHNSLTDYQNYLAKIQHGDSIKVWYDQAGMVTPEGINLHVYQLEKGQEILLDKEQLNKTDKKVGLILYGIGVPFGMLALWFYQTKVRRKTYAQHQTLRPAASPRRMA